MPPRAPAPGAPEGNSENPSTATLAIMDVRLELDGTAIATLAVAACTLLLALATVWLGWQARAETQTARAAEVNRRAEAQVLSADVLVATHGPELDSARGYIQAKWRVVAAGAVRPIFGLTAIVRVPGETVEDSVSTGRGSMAPGEEHTFTFDLSKFTRQVPGGVFEFVRPELEIRLESTGMLGQRVIQQFRWNAQATWNGSSSPLWHEKDREIVPTVGSSVRVRFQG